MSQSATRTGILVGVDGSAESDAAIRWATHEAVMRRAPLTLAHVVAPVVASWPIGPMHANITEWQQDNARHVLEQALKTVQACVPEVTAPRCAHRGPELKRGADIGPRIREEADDRRRQPRNRCARPAAAGLGKYRPGAPCELPGSDNSSRAESSYGDAPVLLGIDG